MGIEAGLRKRTTRVAFTLVELLLVVALLLLLFGAVVFNFNSLEHGAKLDEGAGQVETLFRFARAQASVPGRQVRISFGEATSGGIAAASTGSPTNSPPPGSMDPAIVVTWEPDPIGAPGHFEVLREAAPYLEHLAALVVVRRVPPRGLPAARVPGRTVPQDFDGSSPGLRSPGLSVEFDAAASGESPTGGIPLQPVTFYPDGSSDSAEVMLQSRDDGDARRIAISLAGLTGVIRRRSVTDDPGGESPDDNNAAESTTGSPIQAGAAAGSAK